MYTHTYWHDILQVTLCGWTGRWTSGSSPWKCSSWCPSTLGCSSLSSWQPSCCLLSISREILVWFSVTLTLVKLWLRTPCPFWGSWTSVWMTSRGRWAGPLLKLPLSSCCSPIVTACRSWESLIEIFPVSSLLRSWGSSRRTAGTWWWQGGWGQRGTEKWWRGAFIRLCERSVCEHF